MLAVNVTDNGLVLNVWVQPRSKKNKIRKMKEDALKISVTSPAREGMANKTCTEFLAKELGIKRYQVEIVKGHKSRRKILRITGLTQYELEQRLKEKSDQCRV